jgi:hypothetical protein
MNKILKTVIVWVAVCIYPLMYAQTSPPPPPGGGPPGFPLPGILILAFTGVGYAVYTLKNNPKK